MLKKMLCLALFFALFSSISFAQDAPDQPVFAAVYDNELYISPEFDEWILVENPASSQITDLQWSPDYTKLAYKLMDMNYGPQLMVVEVGEDEAGEPFSVTPLGFDSHFSFTADGDLIYLGESIILGDPPEGDMNPEMSVEVYKVAAEANVTPELLTSIDYIGGDCAFGPYTPADAVYRQEVPNELYFDTLELTDYGLIYQAFCSTNYLLRNLETGEDTDLPGGRPVLSADRTRALISDSNNLLIYDLATLTIIQQVEVSSSASDLIWGTDDDTVFYSTQDDVGEVYTELSEDELEIYNQSGFFDYIPITESTVHQVNLATDEDTLLYTSDAYAIYGLAQDKQTLYFSRIGSLTNWVDAVLSGELRAANGDQARTYTPVEVYQVNLDTGETTPFIQYEGWFEHFTPAQR
jgi:hypothetical protein